MSNEVTNSASCQIAVNDWPLKFQVGQRVEFIVDAYNSGNKKVAKVGDKGTLQTSHLDWNGHVCVLIDGKKRAINTSLGWMRPL